jgi:hypothetical protein
VSPDEMAVAATVACEVEEAAAAEAPIAPSRPAQAADRARFGALEELKDMTAAGRMPLACTLHEWVGGALISAAAGSRSHVPAMSYS